MGLLTWLVTVSIGIPALVAFGLALFRPGDDACWLKDGLIVLWLGALLLARGAGPARTRWLLALCSLAFVLLWPELGMRLAGVRASVPMVMRFGYPGPTQIVDFEADRELFWKLPTRRGGSPGLSGREDETPKPDGTYRMLFFGDSCTAQGYPSLVAVLLNRYLADPRKFEAINFGVPGYSSYQGRVLAERWAEKLEPDLGVVCFGWNDHWQAYGAPDEEKAAQIRRGIPLPRWLQKSRLVTWLTTSKTPSGPLSAPRVSEEEYRHNLEAIGERIEAGGGRVALMTAPGSHVRLGVPAYLARDGFAASSDSVTRLHTRYNDILREVAAARGWLLLDQEQLANSFQPFRQLFKEDGIHYTELGLRWTAAMIARAIIVEDLKLEVPENLEEIYN